MGRGKEALIYDLRTLDQALYQAWTSLRCNVQFLNLTVNGEQGTGWAS